MLSHLLYSAVHCCMSLSHCDLSIYLQAQILLSLSSRNIPQFETQISLIMNCGWKSIVNPPALRLLSLPLILHQSFSSFWENKCQMPLGAFNTAVCTSVLQSGTRRSCDSEQGSKFGAGWSRWDHLESHITEPFSNKGKINRIRVWLCANSTEATQRWWNVYLHGSMI